MSINDDNLLNQVTQTSAEGSAGAEPSQPSQETTTEPSVSRGGGRGSNLLDQADNIKPESAVTEQAGSADNNAGNEPVKDTGTWTKDSALKEVKKLREENKSSRLKYEEMVSKFKQEMDSRLEEKEAERSELQKKAEELDSLKANADDKKRSLEEKLSHRETLLTELKFTISEQQKAFEKEMAENSLKLSSFEAEAEAQMEVYKKRLGSELDSIEEKYRPIADLIIKGSVDSREALIAIQEAKLLGTFAEKRVHVVNANPGAADGARTTQDRIDERNQTARDKMGPSEKIGAALKEIRSGVSNSAYRSR